MAQSKPGDQPSARSLVRKGASRLVPATQPPQARSRDPDDLGFLQLAEELGRLAARARADRRRGYSLPEIMLGSLIMGLAAWLAFHLFWRG